MTDPSSLKKKLRDHFLEKRNTLSDQEVKSKSSDIIHQLVNLKEFVSASTIHTYLPIRGNNEVDTLPLIHECFDQGKKVVVPKIAGSGELQHVELESLNKLEINNWGVPEPGSNRHIPVKELEVVFVPMVAGDRFKNRLGYGKGYYDRFLKDCGAPKVGILFDCQLYKKNLPVESFDIPLDILITESEKID